MKPSKAFFIVLFLFFVGFVGFVGYLPFKHYDNSELAEKSAWAMLQGVEFQHRNDADNQEPALIENVAQSGFSVLGIPTTNPKYPRAWLLLDEHKVGASVKIVPEGENLRISCGYVSKLKGSTSVATDVYTMLISICHQ